jgi:hypothetical protein
MTIGADQYPEQDIRLPLKESIRLMGGDANKISVIIPANGQVSINKEVKNVKNKESIGSKSI